MKRIFAVLLSCMLLLTFAACGAGEDSPQTTQGADEQVSLDGAFPCVTDAMEYTLYQNIFYNNEGANYEGQQVEKTGTFATIYDEFNKVTRYYVWGYYDMTKCCDWQWELKVDGAANLPKNGCLVNVTGTFEKSDSALDGYWITNPEISVKTEYNGENYDVDMSVMSATLERVQIINMQNFKESFEGKKIAAYGRVKTNSIIQHPYYDGAWEQAVNAKTEIQLTDKEVLVTGIYKDGVIKDAVATEASYY